MNRGSPSTRIRTQPEVYPKFDGMQPRQMDQFQQEVQREIKQHYQGVNGPKHHRNKTDICNQAEIVQFQSAPQQQSQHAMSSENLTKNVIMRSQESIDSQA